MRRKRDVLPVLAMMAVLLHCACGAEDDVPGNAKKAQADKGLPAAVSKTLAQAYPGAVIEEVDTETEDGKTIYDVELVMDGKEIEVEIDADGKILEAEEDNGEEDDDGDDEDDNEDDEDEEDEEVPLDQVPQAARDAALQAVPGITLTEAAREEGNSGIVYELEGEASGEEYEIEVTAEGEVLEVEKEDAEDDAGDDEDDGNEDDESEEDAD